jgi:hypothetical protein
MKTFQMPTPSELYSLELYARRERARETGRLVYRAVVAVVAAIERVFAHGGPKGVRHA